jgi:hypothetical protein
VPPRCLLGFRLAIHPAPATDDALDMLRGAGPANREQSFFSFGRRNARQRPDLRVRQLTARERLRQPRQRAERARHAHALAGGARVEPNAPGQPGRARQEAGVPAAAGIEVADKVEQPRSGGVEVRRELGDLVAEPLELDDGLSGRENVGSTDVHRRVLRCSAPTLPPDFRASLRLQDTRSRRDPCCSRRGAAAITAASPRPAGSVFAEGWRCAATADRKGCQAKSFVERRRIVLRDGRALSPVV